MGYAATALRHIPRSRPPNDKARPNPLERTNTAFSFSEVNDEANTQVPGVLYHHESDKPHTTFLTAPPYPTTPPPSPLQTPCRRATLLTSWWTPCRSSTSATRTLCAAQQKEEQRLLALTTTTTPHLAALPAPAAPLRAAQTGEELSDLVQQLRGADVSRETLTKTKVGKMLNSLRRRCHDKQAAARAKNLLRTWQSSTLDGETRKSKKPQRLIDEVSPRWEGESAGRKEREKGRSRRSCHSP